jgi:hypothetical protein
MLHPKEYTLHQQHGESLKTKMKFQFGSKNVIQSKIYLSNDVIPSNYIILFSHTKYSTILGKVIQKTNEMQQ